MSTAEAAAVVVLALMAGSAYAFICAVETLADADLREDIGQPQSPAP